MKQVETATNPGIKESEAAAAQQAAAAAQQAEFIEASELAAAADAARNVSVAHAGKQAATAAGKSEAGAETSHAAAGAEVRRQTHREAVYRKAGLSTRLQPFRAPGRRHRPLSNVKRHYARQQATAPIGTRPKRPNSSSSDTKKLASTGNICFAASRPAEGWFHVSRPGWSLS